MATFENIIYTSEEEAEIGQWLVTSSRLQTPTEPHAELLETLNTHLLTRTTLLGSKPSGADVTLYKTLAPQISKWTPEQRTGEQGLPNIVRFIDFVQNSRLFGLSIPEEEKVKVNLDDVLYFKPPVDPKAEKERLKKEKAATTGEGGGEQTTLATRTQKGGKNAKGAVEGVKEQVIQAKSTTIATDGAAPPPQKKEKKEKAAKPQKAPAPLAPLSPCLIDLRVGHILKAVKHPEADSLYVSTIAMGDKAGTEDTSEYEGQVVRTVCSGLNGLVPLEEMQGRKVVVVCNLKPVKMRGIKSSAMVLAASPRLKEGEEDHHAGPVELVSPPGDATAGERVHFKGWEGEPEPVLNPKKKIWESIQPGFITTPDLGVGFDPTVVKELSNEGLPGIAKLVTASGGFCTVKSLTNGIVR